MAIADDISVAVNGDIRYTGTTANYTVLELHVFLQDLADDAQASGNDLVDITSETPSDKSTDNILTLINGYNIDDTLAEHLYDGSVEQLAGATRYGGLVVVGSAPAGTQLQIVQDGALLTNYWTTGLNADAAQNILLRIMVKTRFDDADIDGGRLRVQARELGDTYAEFSVTMGLGNNTAAIFTAADLNNATIEATIAGWTSITNTEGLRLIDVNNDTVDEEYYSEWNKGIQGINDLYERTKWTQRRGTVTTLHGMNGELFRGVTHSFGYDGEAGTSPTTNDDYAWGLKVDYDNEASGPFVVGEAVVVNATDVGRILAVDDNGVAGTLILAMESGAPANNEQIVGQTSGATADVNLAPVGSALGGGRMRFLAVDDDGTTGNIYAQLLTGTAPGDNDILYETANAANTITVAGSVTARTVSPAFIGASTGSSIIGAYGIGIESADLSASDQLFDLTNTLRVPPNNVTFTVSGLVSGEDYILVGPESGGGLDVTQLSLLTALVGAAETAVVVDTAIPSDTPSAGTIRVTLDSGIERRLAYTSFTGSTFTIASTSFAADNASVAADVYITYLDKLAAATSEAFTYVYSADRSHFVRARDGGVTRIKTFETPATMGSGGGAATIIRTPD